MRDFIYLDTVKLQSFVSQIQGGLISEVSEKIKQLGGLSAGINVGIPVIGGNVDASKGKESEHQQTIQLTDPVYFDVIYRHLEQEKQMVDITDMDEQSLGQLNIGQFVEMRGIVEPPAVENWIHRVQNVFDFTNRNIKLLSSSSRQGGKRKRKQSGNLTARQMKEFQSVLDFLIDYINMSQIDPGKQYLAIHTEKGDYKVWSGLLPEFITVSLHSTLPAEFSILGRVERILKEGESWKIVDLSQFDQAIQTDQLLDVLNGVGSFIGQDDISKNDLQADYPDIFVTPIGLYR
ncbi:MAG: hypothetical protein R3293_26390 [Candidatus Promineifilaceae bacterium]|nr:hypothetical protein [Candidatus Promineifilaceae bacterium]